MKIKTSELKDQALDWAVAKARGYQLYKNGMLNGRVKKGWHFSGVLEDTNYWLPLKLFTPSTNPAQAYPIIDRERISLRDESYTKSGGWYAVILGEDYRYKHVPFNTVQGWDGSGETPLIAAMRCYVASKLGDEVDVPEELCGRGK